MSHANAKFSLIYQSEELLAAAVENIAFPMLLHYQQRDSITSAIKKTNYNKPRFTNEDELKLCSGIVFLIISTCLFIPFIYFAWRYEESILGLICFWSSLVCFGLGFSNCAPLLPDCRKNIKADNKVTKFLYTKKSLKEKSPLLNKADKSSLLGKHGSFSQRVNTKTKPTKKQHATYNALKIYT